MQTLTLKAPAKINLTLEILKRLPNGYHQMRSVMFKLPHLHDELEFKFSPDRDEITLYTNSADVPLDEHNLCYKSAKAFFEKIKKTVGLEIRIKKNIPLGAGLGGGSTNAAATLMALNRYFNYPLNEKQLIKIAASLGKDIPFFFSSKNISLVEGMGEKISKSISGFPLHILLINPGLHVNTAWAYGDLSRQLWYMSHRQRKNKSALILKALERKNISWVARSFYNDFETAIIKHHPIIQELIQSLKAFGALNALMSGSGSTVFGIFASQKELETAKKILSKQYSNMLVLKG